MTNVPMPDFAASLPQMDGEITAAGLDGPVSIHRDQFGIAHISATTEHDAWFGQAYASAQDRLWQMELSRRSAHGRLAELFGEGALAQDRLARTLGFSAAAAKERSDLGREARGESRARASRLRRSRGRCVACAGRTARS